MLIGSDQLKRLEWPLGMVIAAYPGADGRVRVVRLKTATGEIVRPVQRLYPLEISSTEEREIFEREAITKKATTGCDEANMEDVTPKEAAARSEEAIMKETTVSWEEPTPPETKTRSGRVVKAPFRFQSPR